MPVAASAVTQRSRARSSAATTPACMAGMPVAACHGRPVSRRHMHVRQPHGAPSTRARSCAGGPAVQGRRRRRGRVQAARTGRAALAALASHRWKVESIEFDWGPLGPQGALGRRTPSRQGSPPAGAGGAARRTHRLDLLLGLHAGGGWGPVGGARRGRRAGQQSGCAAPATRLGRSARRGMCSRERPQARAACMSQAERRRGRRSASRSVRRGPGRGLGGFRDGGLTRCASTLTGAPSLSMANSTGRAGWRRAPCP
jgi:hypothetical protein